MRAKNIKTESVEYLSVVLPVEGVEFEALIDLIERTRDKVIKQIHIQYTKKVKDIKESSEDGYEYADFSLEMLSPLHYLEFDGYLPKCVVSIDYTISYKRRQVKKAEKKP